MAQLRLVFIFTFFTLIQTTSLALGADASIYSIYTSLNMGNEGEISKKDYYLTIGSRHGINNGSKVKVFRKIASYDLNTHKHQADLEFPIAELTIIHADASTAIARLVRMLPGDSTPAITPWAVQIGDKISIQGK